MLKVEYTQKPVVETDIVEKEKEGNPSLEERVLRLEIEIGNIKRKEVISSLEKESTKSKESVSLNEKSEPKTCTLPTLSPFFNPSNNIDCENSPKKESNNNQGFVRLIITEDELKKTISTLKKPKNSKKNNSPSSNSPPSESEIRNTGSVLINNSPSSNSPPSESEIHNTGSVLIIANRFGGSLRRKNVVTSSKTDSATPLARNPS